VAAAITTMNLVDVFGEELHPFEEGVRIAAKCFSGKPRVRAALKL